MKNIIIFFMIAVMVLCFAASNIWLTKGIALNLIQQSDPYAVEIVEINNNYFRNVEVAYKTQNGSTKYGEIDSIALVIWRWLASIIKGI